MLTINMITPGNNVAGQGVGSATNELIHLLETHAKGELRIQANTAKGADICHVHTVHPLSYAQMLAAKVPIVMHVHFLPDTLEGSIQLTPPFDKLFSSYVMKMYKSADELVVVNPYFIDALEAYQLPREHITYLPNVVDASVFRPARGEHPLIYDRYGIDPEAFNVISVGQVQTRKGVMDFLEVAKRCPQLQFYWAGGFSFGAFTDGYKDLKEQMANPPANVHFLDIVPREEMNALYNAMDVLFMPSYAELFPMAVIEAVNSGLPIVLRDLDLYRVIYFTDYLRASDNAGFADLLLHLRQDSAFYDKALTYSKKIADDYSADSIAQKWIAYYNHVYEVHEGKRKPLLMKKSK